MIPVSQRVGSQAVCAWLIAGMTLREAGRQRWFFGVVLVAGAFVFAVQGLREFNFGTAETAFVLHFGFGVLSLFGAGLVITVTTLLIFNEFEQRTVLTVLARPVARGTFVVGKWLGLAGLFGVYGLAITGMLVALLAARGDADLRLGDVAIGGLLQTLKLSLLAAITVALAVICRTALLTGALALFALVICQLHPVLTEVVAQAEGTVPRAFGVVVVALLPDFQSFDVTPVLTAGEPLSRAQVGRLLVYGAGHTLIALAVAMFAFRQREP